jgi:16S rRNA (cytosine967-C5)-methyltransferase
VTARKPKARDVATHVLVRVEKEGAFASAALEAELGRAVQLDARDRGLATELVYGSLRVAPWLEDQIAPFAPRGIAKLDATVRACLVLAAYQIFFLRVPAFAAVSEAVDAVKAARGPRLAAFANAVLRKVAARAEEITDAERDEAIVLSAPAWLREALDRSLTPAGARAFLLTAKERPPIALRVERETERDAWLERLRAAVPDASFEAGRMSPRAILVRGAGKPEQLPGWSEGAWSVQEEGSQVAALAVGAQPGETVLDACAGRGNKAAVLARAVAAAGALDACDSSPAKLERLALELRRLGLAARATFAVDWTAGSGDVTAVYDRVLVDAPCSGVGTLRRRPEIAQARSRRTAGGGDLAAMARTQLAILSRVADRVRPAGGILVYVVCSVLKEEGKDVLDAFLGSRTDFAPLAEPTLLLPGEHGTDGYFIARLARR